MTTINLDSVKNQRICSKLVEREVGECVSSLVYHFAQNPEALNGSEYSYDDDVLPLLSRYHENTDEIAELQVEIDELEADIADMAETDSSSAEQQKKLKSLQSRLEELEDEQDNPSEVYEHWIVSSWLAGKLREQGESVGELFGLTIWGRTTTGQAISMDSVIQQIAANMEILDGQRNSWAD